MITSVNSSFFTRIPNTTESSNKPDRTAIAVSKVDISRLTDTDFDKEILNNYLKAVDSALDELARSAAVAGADKSRIEDNKSFLENLVATNNRGIGQLINADLNEETAKLKALQTQEQLAIQALGIANSSSQNLQRLFE